MMTNPLSPSSVRSPLQLFGLYLAWLESAMGAALFAIQNVEHWTKYLMIASMAIGLFAWVATTAFMLIYLAINKPGFLFNPSDFDKDVQPRLFDGAPAVVRSQPSEDAKA